jgi:HEAT repeat protein
MRVKRVRCCPVILPLFVLVLVIRPAHAQRNPSVRNQEQERHCVGKETLAKWYKGQQAIAVDSLVPCLNDPDRDVRMSAVALLGGTGDRNAVEPLLRELKADPDDNVRNRAIVALIELKLDDPRELGPLIAVLNESKDGVSSWAPDALSNLKDPRAFQAIVNALNSPSQNVTMEAERALGHLRNPQAIGPLINALKDTRGYAAAALSEIGQPATAPLLDVLKSPDPVLRFGAAKALTETTIHDTARSKGNALDPRVVEAILEAGRDHDFAVTLGAHRFFIDRGDPSSLNELATALVQDQDKGTKNALWEVAEDFLKTRNRQLEDSVVTWAEGQGMRMERDMKGHPRFPSMD